MIEYQLPKRIPLTQGQYATVSAHRFEELTKWRWFANWNRCTQSFYALRTYRPLGGKSQTIPMHRQILGLSTGDGKQGDHRNGNTLDNTDENLRVATARQNMHNRMLKRSSLHGVKGVYFRKESNKWRARITVNGKVIHLGTYDTKEKAAKAYYIAAVWYFGEFARAA